MADSATPGAFGHYRLLRPLGRGGMGEVYLARDERLDRDVAIKFVAPDRTGDPDAHRRLLREAQAAAALDHPCICTVHETGETADGRAFIVMQYVEGEPLAETLRRGPLYVREALLLGQRIAEALAAAHAEGVVHRDLKPGNVIVTASGYPKLVDFGLAKRVVLPASLTERPTLSGATTPGTIVGTPAYMAPEQVQQRPVDRRADLFALGVLLFECLTGQRSFEGPTPFETVANILYKPLPAASSLRPELTDRHDELCWRLTAKEPSERFQSAEEAVGAFRVLLSDTSTLRSSIPPKHTAAVRAVSMLRAHWRPVAVVTVLLAALAFLGGDRLWTRASALPTAPPESERWYRDGTAAIREGSYVRARRNLEQAVRLFPDHALAHARLAEANAELDDANGAQQGLLRVSAIVPNESRLPEVERLRLSAVRALVLRDVDHAVASYAALAARDPSDAGAWLDLGRAQEAAGLRADARGSYERAIQEDNQYAAAYLRLGYVEGLEFRREEALKAFAEAERLYRAASDVEGETEVLLQRGAMHDAFVSLGDARADLERALMLAKASGVHHQSVRARLTLSSVAASEGRFAHAEQIARDAVSEALTLGLDGIAADGLVELAATLHQTGGRTAEAAAHLERAGTIAARRGARRAHARSRVQLASLLSSDGHAAEALAIIEETLPFLRERRFRRFEMFALLVAGRAHEQLDQLHAAHRVAEELLALSEGTKDEDQRAFALGNLASAATALGDFPQALRLRDQAEEILRRQSNVAALPFSLENRSELLTHLGRAADAAEVLAQLEKGIAAGHESYLVRSRYAAYLSALAAAIALRCRESLVIASRVPAVEAQDASFIVLPAVRSFCEARLNRQASVVANAPHQSPPALIRERQYWLAAAAVERGDFGRALLEVDRGLHMIGELPNYQLRWRLAVLGSVAAKALGDTRARARWSDAAREAMAALRQSWAQEVDSFVQRSDVQLFVGRVDAQ